MKIVGYVKDRPDQVDEEDRRVSAEVDDTGDRRDVAIGGRRAGEVMLGSNGEWFWVPLSREAHAYPLEGRDNIRGTGFATPEGAVVAELGLLRYQRVW